MADSMTPASQKWQIRLDIYRCLTWLRVAYGGIVLLSQAELCPQLSIHHVASKYSWETDMSDVYKIDDLELHLNRALLVVGLCIQDLQEFDEINPSSLIHLMMWAESEKTRLRDQALWMVEQNAIREARNREDQDDESDDQSDQPVKDHRMN